MKSVVQNVKMTSLDDLFKTDESRAEDNLEKIIRIPLSGLHTFENHPFKVQDDNKMAETVESVKQNGVLVPAIVRPRENGGYEIVSGHRRKRASELAGLETLPVIIREMDDDVATILLVDSNIQRENLLPSEKAFAYKMKLDAMKRQGERTDLTSSQLGPKLANNRSNAILAEQNGESVKQIQRYIRLTELITPILDMVDNKQIPFNPSVEISYLSVKEQTDLIDIMEKEDSPPSLSQAQRMKKFSQEGKLNYDMMDAIMSEQKVEPIKITLKEDKLRKYFPKDYSAEKIESIVFKLLDNWYRKRQQELER